MTTSITGGRKRPLQKAAVRSSGWTRERRKRFLDTLAETCNVRMSVEAAGMKVPGAYMLRRRDPAFAALWAEALAMGYERLEAALLSRALEGVNDIAIGDEPDEGVEAGGALRDAVREGGAGGGGAAARLSADGARSGDAGVAADEPAARLGLARL